MAGDGAGGGGGDGGKAGKKAAKAAAAARAAAADLELLGAAPIQALLNPSAACKKFNAGAREACKEVIDALRAAADPAGGDRQVAELFEKLPSRKQLPVRRRRCAGSTHQVLTPRGLKALGVSTCLKVKLLCFQTHWLLSN